MVQSNDKYEMIKDEMMEYYDERADEFDEIYEGKGPASFPSDYYKRDVEDIGIFMKGFGKGHIIDIACGSGFWIQYYCSNCNSFTFFDQSKKMLNECMLKAKSHGIFNKSDFINDDILQYNFNSKYDSAFIGFLISHFAKNQEDVFFNRLKNILKPGSDFMIVDGAWNKERANKYSKEDIVERQLNDGRKFNIYKKYYDKNDLSVLLEYYGFKVKRSFFGNVFTAIIGEV
jgi:ubiquinone/menaquinone biosynthesis C-methylase UbiE